MFWILFLEAAAIIVLILAGSWLAVRMIIGRKDT